MYERYKLLKLTLERRTNFYHGSILRQYSISIISENRFSEGIEMEHWLKID